MRALAIPLVLSLASACASLEPGASPIHYLTPTLTYLRDAPSPAANVKAQMYQGEQVESLDGGDNDGVWRQVRSGRTGQTGWVQAESLSPDPVPVTYLYVRAATVPLRECPQDASAPLQLLYGGDRVQEVESEPGWTRVLVEKGRTLGWLPQEVLAGTMEKAQPIRPVKPYAYVAVPHLRVRLNPTPDAPVVKTLALNQQVQRLQVNAGTWVKVREPAKGTTGWVLERYLAALPVNAVRRTNPAKKKRPNTAEREIPEIM